MSILNKLKENREHGSEYAERKEQGYRVISPSGLKKYYTNPYEWSLNVLDNVKTFSGNTNTVLGLIVHKYAELYRTNSLNKDGTIPSIEIDRIISSTTDLDIKEIYANYPTMCQCLKDEYLELYPNENVLDSELYLELDIKEDKILVAGTLDELYSEGKDIILVDFKTSTSPYKDETDLMQHLHQFSVYNALLLKNRGIQANKFRVVNIAKPTMKETNRLTILECDSSDISNSLLNEVIETIRLCDSNQDIKKLIFRENIFDGYMITDKNRMNDLCSKYIKNFSMTNSQVKKKEKVIKSIFS